MGMFNLLRCHQAHLPLSEVRCAAPGVLKLCASRLAVCTNTDFSHDLVYISEICVSSHLNARAELRRVILIILTFCYLICADALLTD
jgi:hypothetical protein